MVMVFLSIGEFANRIGVTIQTLRNWDKSDKLKPHHRTFSGHRVYAESQIDDYFNESGVSCSEHQ